MNFKKQEKALAKATRKAKKEEAKRAEKARKIANNQK